MRKISDSCRALSFIIFSIWIYEMIAGLYYISSEMRCTVICCVYTEKLVSPCLYFSYRIQHVHLQYLHKACIIKNRAKSLVKDILCQQCCIKEQCTNFKQRKRQSISFLHMPLTMTVIFSKYKLNQNKAIFNWGGGVNAQCVASFSHQIWRYAFIICERPEKWSLSSVKNLQKGKTVNNARQDHHSVTHFLQVVWGLLGSWML